MDDVNVGEGSGSRDAAIKRIKARREFVQHVVVYVVVNGFLVAVWALTGQGYFWPAWVMAGWGIGLVLHAWSLYGERPITEEDIEREVHRHGGHAT